MNRDTMLWTIPMVPFHMLFGDAVGSFDDD
jgi:hypothetical protein